MFAMARMFACFNSWLMLWWGTEKDMHVSLLSPVRTSALCVDGLRPLKTTRSIAANQVAASRDAFKEEGRGVALMFGELGNPTGSPLEFLNWTRLANTNDVRLG